MHEDEGVLSFLDDGGHPRPEVLNLAAILQRRFDLRPADFGAVLTETVHQKIHCLGLFNFFLTFDEIFQVN